MQYNAYDFNSFKLYTIKTNKFKNCHLEVVFRNKINQDEIMNRKFLIELLAFTTKNYDTQKKLSLYLEELYNMSFYPLISRVGGSILTTFCFDFLNPRYTHKGYLDEVLNLITEIIFNPDIKDNEFNSDYFNIIKNNIICEIKASKENIKSYAYRRLFKNMDSTSYLSYDMIGNIDDIELITSHSVKEEYDKMLNNDYFDIYLVGDLDMDYVATYFENNFYNRIIKTYDIPLVTNTKTRNKIQIVKENEDINQAHLLMGCNLVNLTKDQKDVVAYVYNYLLGGGSLDTKLGQCLRQENAMCYTVSSIYQKYDGVIVIYAGIDEDNYEKCVKLIKKALKDMINNLTEEELENAKKNIITALNMINDNPASLVNNYLFKNIADLKDVEDRIKDVKKITIADIKNFAKRVKINTIYLLSGVK